MTTMRCILYDCAPVTAHHSCSAPLHYISGPDTWKQFVSESIRKKDHHLAYREQYDRIIDLVSAYRTNKVIIKDRVLKKLAKQYAHTYSGNKARFRIIKGLHTFL
jgi:hypothetical protein